MSQKTSIGITLQGTVTCCYYFLRSSLGVKYMTLFSRYYAFSLLHSPYVELYLLLVLIHTFARAPPHHNTHPIFKVTPSIWENLWSVRQFIQSVDVQRIQLQSRFVEERKAQEDSRMIPVGVCVCVCV